MSTPSPFDGFEQLEGLDFVDKRTLVGKPFGITGVRFRTNERDVVFAEAEVVTEDGEKVMINDSSTGIRDQLSKYLADKGHAPSANSEWVDVKLFVPRGLRVSKYEVMVGGKPKPSETYYLTTSGHRPSGEQNG